MNAIKTFSALTVALGLTLSGTVTAAPQQGDQELQLGGGFFHTQGADSGTLNANVSWGKYTTDNWLVGIEQGVSYSFIDGADDIWSASTTLSANYNFITPNEKLVPFVGAFLGALYNEDDTTGTVGPQAGLKYYVDKNTFLMARYRYEWAMEEVTVFSFRDSFNDNSSDGNHVVTVGFGINF